jgi:hypothetical protein
MVSFYSQKAKVPYTGLIWAATEVLTLCDVSDNSCPYIYNV